jgi:DNA modification methylase
MSDVKLSSLLHDSQTPAKVFGLKKGDSRDLVGNLSDSFAQQAIADGFIDVTITSPPYADLKNYDGEEDPQIGFGDDYEDYLEQLRQVFKQVYQVTKDTGTLWVVVNTFKRKRRVTRLPFDIADTCENLPNRTHCEDCETRLQPIRDTGGFKCEQCGREYDPLSESWRLEDIIVWDKERARPYSDEKSFRNVFEYILHFSKSDDQKFDFDSVRIANTNEFEHWWVDWPERYHPRGKVPENIWQMVTPAQGKWGMDYEHPAPFPPALVERIIRLTTDPGNIVLDPFGGTGSVPAQAALMDRYGLGFDVSDKYVNNYDKIERKLEEKWNERKKEGQTLEKRQQELAKIMWGLRQLVYGKRLYREFRQASLDVSNTGIRPQMTNTIFIQAYNLDPVDVEPSETALRTDLFFVMDSDAPSEYLKTANEKLQSYTEQQPWRGFNLDAETHAVTTETFQNEIDDTAPLVKTGRLFLYPAGHHHRYERTISLIQWVNEVVDGTQWREEFASESYPPLISNIGIQIDREGESPTLERGTDDEPPAELKNSEYEYSETVSTGTKSTRITDF